MNRLILLMLPVFLLGLTCSLPEYANAAAKTYQRSQQQYQLPDVTLVNQDGKRVRLKNIIDTNKPVVVDFIFGTCTTICPVLSAGFINLQNRLGADATKVHLVSITIDPENDNPKVMKEYLKRYRAKPGWDFFTGSRRDIDLVMNAFGAYIPNKMSHYAVTFIHAPQSTHWIKLYGIMSSTEFMEEVRKVGL